MRTPSVSESLAVFKCCFSQSIDSVVDVGVQVKTGFLMDAFPQAHHYLFEPVLDYHQMIISAYRSAGIQHTIIGSAVSDSIGKMFLHLLSNDLSGKITHSQLLPTPDHNTFGDRLIGVREIEVISLDTWMVSNRVKLGKNYVVKIDVDGIEDKIITGAENIISNAAVVLVEANLVNLTSRTRALEGLGLKLFDIVGNAYYFDQLQQVDLVFVSEGIVKEYIDFRPRIKYTRIIWDKWQQFL